MQLQSGNTVDVIATDGHGYLGGDNSDKNIMDFAAKRFEEVCEKPLKDLPRCYNRLLKKVMSEKHLP